MTKCIGITDIPEDFSSEVNYVGILPALFRGSLAVKKTGNSFPADTEARKKPQSALFLLFPGLPDRASVWTVTLNGLARLIISICTYACTCMQ